MKLPEIHPTKHTDFNIKSCGAINQIHYFTLPTTKKKLPILSILPLKELTLTQRTNPDRVISLAKAIESQGKWNSPIYVHDTFKFIMSGNHRYEACKTLGLTKIPSLLVNYELPFLKVVHWLTGKPFKTNEILEGFHKKQLLGYKASKHILDKDLPTLNIDLELLK